MCTSKPRAPAPIPNAPIAMPTSEEDEAIGAQRESLRRRRGAYGRQQTILAGAMGAGQPPTMPTKSALGV